MKLSRFTFHVLRFMFHALLLLALLAPVATLAQSGGDYDLSWFTVDGGGGLNSNGNYSLHGTAGQPDAGFLAEGEYTLSGGFWGGGAAAVAVEHTIYLPLVLRNY
jgi:hypothetical protein